MIESSSVEKRSGTFTSFDGTQIYYEVRGRGRPIVMCYGLACLINHWTHQIKYFSNSYQTIVFDYRGHHRSGTPENLDNLTLSALSHDLRGLLDHLQIPKASIWGHSLGVQILLDFYDKYPDSISNMVFINGFAENPFKDTLGADAAGAGLYWFKQFYANYPEVLNKIWKFGVTHPLAVPLSGLLGGFNLRLTKRRDIDIYARSMSEMDLNVFLTLFGQMLDFDGRPVLDKIKEPVLIISGKSDTITPLAYQEELNKRIAHSEILRIPYGSHCTQLDLPDFVNLRIDKFFADIGYSSKP